MQINFEIKIPEELEGDERQERIEIDLKTVISGLHDIIPELERKHIKVKDGKGVSHKYESFNQIKEIYQRDGKIGLFYVGSDSKFEK